MRKFDRPIIQKKKMKLWRLSKIAGSILNYGVCPLLQTYTGEKRTTFAKTYGIKVMCYWELFGEHVRRSLRPICFDLLPPPLPKKKTCMERWLPNVQVESQQWMDSPVSTPNTTLKNKGAAMLNYSSSSLAHIPASAPPSLADLWAEDALLAIHFPLH
jgi:hypothetical protein